MPGQFAACSNSHGEWSMNRSICFKRFYLVVCLFILEMGWRASRGRGRWRRRMRISSRLHAEHRAWCGGQSHHPETMTWAKIKSQTLSWLSHPGALNRSIFKWSRERSTVDLHVRYIRIHYMIDPFRENLRILDHKWMYIIQWSGYKIIIILAVTYHYLFSKKKFQAYQTLDEIFIL